MLTPDSLFEARPTGATALQPYSSFLARCASAREAGEELEARLALGAYLVLRLVDRAAVLPSDPDPGAEDGFRWQLSSALRFIAELPKVECVEASHLDGLVNSVADLGRGGRRPLRINLLAYSWHLEQAGRIEEALDAVAASVPFYADAAADDRMHLGMTAGRYHRTLAHWELADRGYAFGQEAAEVQEDRRSILLARLGRAKVLTGKGNLPEARQRIEEIIAEAGTVELADAKAWAYADLATVLDKQEQPWESLRANYYAFLHYRDSHDRARVLGNLGSGLRAVGALSAAQSAFESVLRTTTEWALTANAKVELMAIGASRNDELSFRRYWQAAQEHASAMMPGLAVDFRYQVGVGLNRFGKRLAAHRWLTEARDIAEANNLNGWYFRLDAAVQSMSVGSELPIEEPRRLTDREISSAEEIETGLRRFAEALAG